MDSQTIVILGNSLIMVATLIATLYRIKIERDQIKLLIEQARRKEFLESFRKHIRTEKKEILDMDKKELEAFLDELARLGEE